MRKDKVLVFIPMYNCENQIPRVLSQFDEKVTPYIDEIIVVNNRSTDNGENVVLEYIEKMPSIKVSLLRNDNNYGLGGSHKVAFNYAINNSFDYVIVLHGDDQGDIHDMLPLLKSGEYRSFDCCLGARFMKGSKLKGYSTFRTFGNHIYNGLFTLATGKRIYDLGSGLNIYKTTMLSNKFFLKFSDNLMFNCYMLLANSYYKLNVKFFPVSWREDDQMSNVKLFSQGIRTFKIAVGYFVSTNKQAYIKKDFRDNSEVVNYSATIIKNNQVSVINK